MDRSATIAERLHLLRKRLKLTQSELAARVGVSQASISSWERGEFAPAVIELVAMADLASVAMDWLTGRCESPTGLQPGHFLIDLDVVADSSRDKELWRVEIPKHHRVVDYRGMRAIEDEMKERKRRPK